VFGIEQRIRLKKFLKVMAIWLAFLASLAFAAWILRT